MSQRPVDIPTVVGRVIPPVNVTKNGETWWDVIVDCPFCGEEHGHGVYASLDQRAADCAPRGGPGDYLIRAPWLEK